MLLVDNYDSFTFNLVQLVKMQLTEGSSPGDKMREASEALLVRNRDTFPTNAQALKAHLTTLALSGVLIGPGPGRPEDAGVVPLLLEVLALHFPQLPVLGVCLGHQAMAQRFGGEIVRAARLMHGRTSEILHDGRGVFTNLELPFTATRYHSLVVHPGSLPACFEVSAETAEREIMGIRHRTLPWSGVQFHPESFLSPAGPALMRKWLGACR